MGKHAHLQGGTDDHRRTYHVPVVRRASRRGGEPLHLDLQGLQARKGRPLHRGRAGSRLTVLAVEFELNGQKLVAINGGPQFTFNEAISFQIHCNDQDEVDYYWSKLSEGGEEVACGRLKDKHGLSWQVIPTVLIDMTSDPDPEKAKRATKAMLAMTKVDIAALQKAHAGE